MQAPTRSSRSSSKGRVHFNLGSVLSPPGTPTSASEETAYSLSDDTSDPATPSSRVEAVALPEVDEAHLLVPHDIQSWGKAELAKVKEMQKANRNHGMVDLMMSRLDGHFVAVKRMPNEWVRGSPQEFAAKRPGARERPWHDLGILRWLNELGCAYVCKLEGVFRDDVFTYVTTTFADQGDLFDWASDHSPLGEVREAKMRPIVSQIFSAVQWLHNHGIAHRDLCMENILLVSEGSIPQVKIIDFGMATLANRFCAGAYGNRYYQAPEMHAGAILYDAFLSDIWAVGVVLFAMATRDYPWKSTVPQACRRFDFISRYGLSRFLSQCHARQEAAVVMAEVVSPHLVLLLEGLLAPAPGGRWSLGEDCYGNTRRCALQAKWL